MQKAMRVLREEGFFSLLHRARDKAFHDVTRTYHRWFLAQSPSEGTLAAQREAAFPTPLLISIVVAVYNTDPAMLRELIDSFLAQTYPQWEACLYDASDRLETLAALRELGQLDPRIRIVHGEVNRGISGNNNLAVGMARGEYIALCDHDDLLTPDALYEMRRAIDETQADLLYSDEDKVLERSKAYYFEGSLKPDFSEYTLRSSNYICHLTVMRRSLFEKLGGFDSAFDGSQDHDLMLRACEATTRIAHVPKVLYHWRMVMSSASHRGENRCVDAAGDAVRAHLLRLSQAGEVSRNGLGYQLVRYPVPGAPLLSVLLWHSDARPVPAKRIAVLIEHTAYRPLEIVLSIDDADSLPAFDGVSVRALPRPTGALTRDLNVMAREAKGDVICFLNADLLPAGDDWAEQMVAHALLTDVGIVSSAIVGKHKHIRACGCAVGRTGGFAPIFSGLNWLYQGNFWQHRITREVSAQLCDYMALRRELFWETGGFDESGGVLAATLSLCLALRKKGAHHLYQPMSRMIERPSRIGSRLFALEQGEEAALRAFARTPDPFYNPQFRLGDARCKLPRLPKRAQKG